MKKSKKDIIFFIMDSCIKSVGIFVFFIVLFYIILKSKGYYHSDCTDTIMWAQASYDAGALMNPDFAYAAIMPFGGQLIMLPLVALFGVGIRAQVIGMVIFFELFVAALIFLSCTMKFSGRWISVMAAWVLILLSSSEKLREIFWGHIIYYSLGIFFLMIGFGIVLEIINAENELFENEDISGKDYKKVIILIFGKQKKLYLFLFIWTAFCSANGIQTITLYGIPVLGAVIAERFFDFGTKFTDKKNINRYIVIVLLIFGMAFGMILGKSVSGGIEAGYANAYSTFSESEKWIDNIMGFFPQFLTLLGVNVNGGMVIYSFEGILNLIKIICAVMLITVPVIMVFFYRRFEHISYRLMILIHHFLTILIMIGWIFGKLSAANWRLSPIVATSAVLCVMFLRWILINANYKRLAAIVVIPIICMTLIVTKDLCSMPRQTYTNMRLNELAEFLEKNDLEYGYATFWNSNIITLISNSKVKVRVIELDEETGYEKRMYQTNKNWYEKAEGYDRYFVILSNSEYNEKYIINEKIYEEPEEILTCGSYKVLIYNHNLF